MPAGVVMVIVLVGVSPSVVISLFLFGVEDIPPMAKSGLYFTEALFQ